MKIKQFNFFSFVKVQTDYNGQNSNTIRNFMFFIESLKSKKNKLALTLFYYVIREIWLGNSKKLICIDQSRFYIFSQQREFKNV